MCSATDLDDSKDIGDGFFHDGLEEVSTHNPDADLVGFMPPVDVPELPREECPPRITTAKPGGLPFSPEHQAPPTWDPENDTTFLDPNALVDSPTVAERFGLPCQSTVESERLIRSTIPCSVSSLSSSFSSSP